jgi:dTDP-4-amino-4,6-dideoxygalactose transaminase
MKDVITRTIPFFDYKIFAKKYNQVLANTFQDVINRGAFILQKDLEDFENKIAGYLNVKHAIGVANCTDGLMLALRAVGIKEGDEVILPSHTFVATAAAVHFLGAIPVLVDCGRDHLMDPEVFEKAITKHTKAVMPVHLNGRTCDMDRIMSIANKHSLMVVEDAAQALGSRFKDKFAGTFGLVGAISFYPAKTLGCLGDAGIVITNDDEVANKIFALHEHGRNKNGDMIGWGLNSRLDNLQAAFLNIIFQDYELVIGRRRSIASLYQEQLRDIKELLLPPSSNSDTNHYDIYQNYEIQAEDRDNLQTYLKSFGIGTLRQWGGAAVHQHKCLGFNIKLPYTDKMMSKELLLPINMSIVDDGVIYVCDRIKQFYK